MVKTALIAAAVFACCAVPLTTGVASAKPPNGPCVVLLTSDTPGLGAGAAADLVPILNGCSTGHCFSRIDDNGQSKCEYSRGASVVLKCASSARRARALVQRELRRGYRRVDVGADLAGVAATSKLAVVVLAVGRAEVVFDMGAASDTNPNPIWPGVKRDVLEGARNITHGHIERRGVRRRLLDAVC